LDGRLDKYLDEHCVSQRCGTVASSTMDTSVTPLRASCDWCRAQKLRCVPSSDTDPTAPCQRCLRAKTPKSCVFSRRLRTGRYTKVVGDAETQPGMARKEKDSSTSSLPGMSAFSLSSLSPPECPGVETHDALGSPRTKGEQGALGLDDKTVTGNNSAPGEMTVAGLWEHDNTALHPLCWDASFQQPSNLLFGADAAPAHLDESSTSEPGDSITASMKADYPFDVAAYLDAQDFLLSPPYDDMEVDMDMLAVEKPGPLVDLTALLAKMSPYENQLSRLSGGELDHYPIGDALFLSQRFYAILSDYGHFPPTDHPSSHLDMPTKLLTLSCYMTLTRIYSSVFGHLHEHLSQLPHAHSGHETRRLSHPSMADMHAYRGLCLGQLQPMCMCAGREPATRAKKAVSMLLGSLAGAEGALGLPPDVRVTAVPLAEAQGEGSASPKSGGGERMVLFEEGLMVGLTNGRLYKTVREQARELRGKVEEVDDLLKGLLEM
jgi:hypothetical protein